jgi:SpoVK/Ycf46/Vps4 family AAA+-type ATPase
MFRAAQQDGRECDAMTVLAERHNALARSYGHLVDIVKPSYGFEGIAGLDNIKRFFGHVRDDIAKGMLARVPMGCLLMGPPGTGKTAIAEAFAEECGFLFVKIRNVRSMWVGETERQMEDLIAGLRELAPVVVLRDEVDQEDTGRDSFQGDSGVSARVRQKWMEFLSDPVIRGRVFVISCSNRPDLLDAALKRSGRTDERIPVLMPDAETRKRLFPVMLKRVQGSLPGITIESTTTQDELKRLADMTESLSGADIEVIVRHSVEYGKVVDGTKIVVDAKCMKRAVEDFIPSASVPQIAYMTFTAIKNCARKEFLPKDAAKIVEKCLADLGIKVDKSANPSLDAMLANHKPEKGSAN